MDERGSREKGNGVTDRESTRDIESNYDYTIKTLTSGDSSILFCAGNAITDKSPILWSRFPWTDS
jgi:hypothetical protein